MHQVERQTPQARAVMQQAARERLLIFLACFYEGLQRVWSVQLPIHVGHSVLR